MDEETIKKCSKCGEEKPLSEYNKWSRVKDGRKPQCRECQRIETREYTSTHREQISNYSSRPDVRERENVKHREKYASNPELFRQKAKEWRAANPEKHKIYKDEYHRTHKEEERAARAIYYAENHEKLCQKSKDYAEENKEIIREKNIQRYQENYEFHVQWREEHREKLRETKKKHCEKNKEKIAARRRELYEQNKERERERKRIYLKENPEQRKATLKKCKEKKKAENPALYKLNHAMSGGIRRSLLNGKEGKSWQSMVDFSLAELRIHIENKFLPGMSWNNMDEWHIDHIRPLSWFNFYTPEDIEFKECWSIFNLQPLWKYDNMSKNNRYAGRPDEIIEDRRKNG